MTYKEDNQMTPKSLIVGVSLLTVAEASAKPNIVCIVSEDNSREYMSLFEGDRGTHTPNIEALAREGVCYTNVYSNGPVSSAARSTLITGMYGVRMASHLHRGEVMVEIPDGVEMFPAYLRRAGYYTVNNAKEDYNVIKGDDVWDESSRKGSWRNRAEGQPFYYVHNIADTHEGQIIKSHAQLKAELGDYQPSEGVKLQPYLPQTELFVDAYRFYCKRVEQMDSKLGDVVEMLREDGLLDDTIIIYYADNGGILPGSKGYLSEAGLTVPMVIRVPEKYRYMLTAQMGTRDERAVNFLDLGATILKMAGVELPEGIDGRPISDCCVGDPLYGYADRMGEKYDMVRSIRVGDIKYVRNFQPFNFNALSNDYRYKLSVYQELREMYKAGKLNSDQSQFFEPKEAEMLYDLSSDPYELNNLAGDPSYQDKLLELRQQMIDWQLECNDIGLIPEFYWVTKVGAKSAELGERMSGEIERYLTVANYQLQPFKSVEKSLKSSLQSDDMIERYWALVVCSSFGQEAKSLSRVAESIAKGDSQPIIRARAAEFLALAELWEDDMVAKVMCEALYQTSDKLEATLILNSMTMLSEGQQAVSFTIDHSRLGEGMTDHTLIKSALAKHKTK